MTEEGKIRTFDTGATRDSKEGKLEYRGFINPAVEREFAKYMHKHRKQPDGKLRSSDNWQKGMPVKEYVDSLLRHVWDVWLLSEGYEREDGLVGREALVEALQGVKFNTNGLTLELLKQRQEQPVSLGDLQVETSGEHQAPPENEEEEEKLLGSVKPENRSILQDIIKHIKNSD